MKQLSEYRDKGAVNMRITISGKNIELTEGLKDAVNEKLAKLDKYFTKETDASVTLSVEKNRQKIEVTIPMKGSVLRAEEVTSDMYASIDQVVETLDRQLNKYRKKFIAKKKGGDVFLPEFLSEEVVEDDDELKIERVKRFGVKPMYPEDACLEMELLGHDFFVFLNAESDEVNVVYKRKGGSYGLIEPEF